MYDLKVVPRVRIPASPPDFAPLIWRLGRSSGTRRFASLTVSGSNPCRIPHLQIRFAHLHNQVRQHAARFASLMSSLRSASPRARFRFAHLHTQVRSTLTRFTGFRTDFASLVCSPKFSAHSQISPRSSPFPNSVVSAFRRTGESLAEASTGLG